MAGSYTGTDVPVGKSQEDLRKSLRRFGADQFTFGEGSDWAGLEFVHDDYLVRFRCPVRQYDRAAAIELAKSSHQKTLTAETWPDAELRRVWRVLVWSVKARLVAVEEGLETVEQAFLAHVVDPATGRTIWQHVHELVEAGALKLGGRGLPELMPGA